jgi:hypothetical protein
MGIFDIFTGDSAREAAEANQARLTASKTAGMGYLDTGRTGALDSLTAAGGYYAPLASKYGKATTLGLDALGVNGPEGNTRATSAFQAGPGYQYAVDQALEGINRKGAATGMLASGNTLAALSDRAGNTNGIGSWRSIAGYVSPDWPTSGQAGAPRRRLGLRAGCRRACWARSRTTQGINSQERRRRMELRGLVIGGGLNLAKLGIGAATGGTSCWGRWRSRYVHGRQGRIWTIDNG